MDKQTISCCAFREEVASYIIEFLKIKEWSIDNKMFAFIDKNFNSILLFLYGFFCGGFIVGLLLS